MTSRPDKILALQFKYFGDAVLMTPALRALREHCPQAEIHLLVPAEIAPLFHHLPWLTRVWAMPRRRGSANLRETWPLIRALRQERFDRSVDFASNDRGAILSFLIGTKNRLGWSERGGFWGRRYFYHHRVASKTELPHESTRLAELLSGWQIPLPASLEAEIHPDAALAGTAQKILPDERSVICHIASSQPKKEWPIGHWAKFHQLAANAGYRPVFTTARGEREAALMEDLNRLLPEAKVLPQITDLSLFLAVLARASAFVSSDTGPLHFAAGLGIPTISLFGPTSPARWAPVGAKHQILTGGGCDCDGNWFACASASPCLAQISPERVLSALENQKAGGFLNPICRP